MQNWFLKKNPLFLELFLPDLTFFGEKTIVKIKQSGREVCVSEGDGTGLI